MQFQGRIESHWLGTLLSWIVPALVFVAIWGLFMRRMGTASGLMSIGKSKAKVYVEQATGVTFDDVAGIDEARPSSWKSSISSSARSTIAGLAARSPRGAARRGPRDRQNPPGQGGGGRSRGALLQLERCRLRRDVCGRRRGPRARPLRAGAGDAPSIIFIDELDALGKARGISPLMGGHDEREQTLNQLLAEMDGFDTQRRHPPGRHQPARDPGPGAAAPGPLRPPGGDRPAGPEGPGEDPPGAHAAGDPGPGCGAGADCRPRARVVGADLANLVNEAALRAAREGKEAVEMVDFEEAIDRVIAGIERKSRVISPKEKAIVAYHEAGHALVAEARPHADRVAKISIIPRGVAALGYTQQQPTEDRYLMTRAELLDRLDVLLGGRTAEELIFGDVSTGAQDDLQRATDLVRHMITRYGMSDALGLATFEAPRQALFLQVPTGAPREYSEETARVIDAEIQQLLEAAHTRVG